MVDLFARNAFWVVGILVAVERLAHIRSSGSGSRWFAPGFILASIVGVARAMTPLVGNLSDVAPRILAAVAALVLAVAGGAYLTHRSDLTTVPEESAPAPR